MPVIGYAANNGHLSYVYRLGQNDFFAAAADAVHAAHTPVLADLVFRFIWQREIRNKIIALLMVGAAHFLQ